MTITKNLFKTGEKQTPKPKKKKHRTWMIVPIILVLIAAVAIYLSIRSKAQNGLVISYDDTTVLTRSDFSNTISATGTVQSSDTYKINSTQSYTVQEVYVEVGDKVTADTLLCQLDTSSLEEQIKTKETSSGVSAASAAQQVKSALDSYNASKSAIENGENSSLISAESSIRTAWENYEKAVNTYNNYKDTLNDGLNTTLISQDSAVESAVRALETAKSSYDAAFDAYLNAENAKNNYNANLSAFETALSEKQAAQRAAQQAYDDSKAAVESNPGNPDLATALAAAQQAYDDAKTAAENDPGNPDLALAHAAAEQAYNEAKTAAENDPGNPDLALALVLAEQALDAAIADTQAAESALYAARSAAGTEYEALESAYTQAQTALDNAESALDSAQSSYASAIKSREAAYRSADNTLADYAFAVDTAYAAYQAALKSYNAALASANTSLQSSYNSLASAEISADNSSAILELANLQQDLEETSIYAGVAGTVTTVYASVGSSGSGLLFVIEDVNELEITTSVKEYDVSTVSVGMPVTIKSQATGDAEYDGTILSVAPTTTKDASGNTSTTGDGEFAVKVKVTSKNTDLRIGMSVRLNYIIEQQDNVMMAPYDAVYENESGKSCILTIEENGDGTGTLRELEVTTGEENDLDIIISGLGVTEGLRIVNSPDNYSKQAGMRVTLGNSIAAVSAATGFGGMMPRG